MPEKFGNKDQVIIVSGGGQEIDSILPNPGPDLAPYHIRVNGIAPGHIDTPGTSQWRPPEVEKQLREGTLGRLGQPEDIATVALFLASNASAYMTGETILVDGGVLLSRP